MAKSRKRKPKKLAAKPASNHDHEHAVLSLFVGVSAVLGLVMIFIGLHHPAPVSAVLEVQTVDTRHH